MPHRTIFAALLSLFAFTASGCIEMRQIGCTSDDDCRFGRYCSPSGFCATPGPLEPVPDAGPDVDAPDTPGTPPGEPQPRLVAIPARITFERIDNSDPTWRRAWRETTVRNAGNAELTIHSVGIFGDPSFELEVPDEPDGTWPSRLAPGESFDVRIWYETRSNEPVAASLLIRSNDPRGDFSVPVSADPNPPCVEVSPERNLVFRPEQPNQRIVKEVIVKNCADDSHLAIREVRLEIDGGGGFYVPEDELPPRLPEHSALIAPGESVAIPVVYTGRSFDWNEGEMVIETNVPQRRIIRIGLLRETDENDCPIARAGARTERDAPYVRSLQASVGEAVEITARDSVDPDGQIVRHAWSLVGRPDGSRAIIEPNTTARDVSLTPDRAGQYLVELQVWDDDGASSCGGVDRVTVVAE